MDSALSTLDGVDFSGARKVKPVTDSKNLGGSVIGFACKVFMKLEVFMVRVIEWNSKGHCDQLCRENGHLNNQIGYLSHGFSGRFEKVPNSLEYRLVYSE